MGFDSGNGFAPKLGGGGGGGSITWTDGQVGFGITGDVVMTTPDFTYVNGSGLTDGFRVGLLGHTGIKLISDVSGVLQSVIGDVDGFNNNTYINVVDARSAIELSSEIATIGKSDNFGANVSGFFSLGTILGVPVIGNTVGVYNGISNTSTGDIALAGAGDLTTIGGSTESVFLGHFSGDNSYAVYLADNFGGVPTIISATVDATPMGIVNTQTNASWSVIGSQNTSSISMDDNHGVISIAANSGTLGYFSNGGGAISVSIGDVDGIDNGTHISVDDSARKIFAGCSTSGSGFLSNSSSNVTSIGDVVGNNNSTVVSVDDVKSLVRISNVPTFANDAAAIAGGLSSGNLYKSTNAGTTLLKIVP